MREIVQDGYDEIEDTSNLEPPHRDLLKESRRKNAKASMYIQQGVGDTILPRVIHSYKVKEAWDLLQQEYGGNKKMEERRICEKILICLPEKFEPILAVLEETKDSSTLKSQELWASLKVYEQMLLIHSEKSIESALQSKLNLESKNSAMKKNEYKGDVSSNFKGKGIWKKGGANSNKYTKSDSSQVPRCNFCKKNGHLEKNCWNKGNPQCHNCKKYEHSVKDCRYKEDEDQDGRTEEKEDKQILFYACQSAWFVDSGCTTHMSGEKSLFVDMDTSINSLVKMGDGNMVQATGRGTIRVQPINGAVVYLEKQQNDHSRDVLFDEGASWNWEEGKIEKSTIIVYDEQENSATNEVGEDEEEGEELSQTPPNARFRASPKASKEPVWIKAMEEEVVVINDNDT
ncbi:uncharacterized protein LOC113279432 [Papaver somniferum]|uniref:uncharacterized protein LOC113279432 n=1 Tax=Papaver somniferum TaxID=3469 RepID=UPI000E6F5791|nr:uncharacterized protein LOC113279432 [Papaver somniferum]